MTIHANAKLTEQQLQLIIDALDLYSRIGMGQVEKIVTDHRGIYADLWKDRENFEAALQKREALTDCLNLFNRIMWGLQPHAFHSIYSPDIDDVNRVAYDMQQVLRHELWKVRGVESIGVNAYPANQSSQVPLVVVKLEKDTTT